MMCLVAMKLMEGKAYHIVTDNPKTVARVRDLTEHMGAHIEINQTYGEQFSIYVSPPWRQ
jgi:hypothetical protein